MARKSIGINLDDNDMNSLNSNFTELYGYLRFIEEAKQKIDDFLLFENVITNKMLMDGSISHSKLGDGVVHENNIGDYQVTKVKIAGNSVDSLRIEDEAVINSKIKNRTLTAEKADKGAWTRNELSKNFMDSGQIIKTQSIDTVFSDGFYMIDAENTGTFPDGEANDNNWTLEVKTLSNQWCHQTLAKRTQPHIRYLRRIRTTTNEVMSWVKILNDSEKILNSQLSTDFLYRGRIPIENSIDEVFSDGNYILDVGNVGTFPDENDKSGWVMTVSTIAGNWTTQTLIKRTEPNIRYVRAIRNDRIDLYPWVFIGAHKSNVATKTFKMLMIGNSYDLDVTEYLAEIAASAGVDVKIGILYRAGERLSAHYDNAINKSQNYAYHIRSSMDGNATKEVIPDVSISDAVEGDDWDIITFHQRSTLSDDYSTYQPYLNDLQSFVKNISTNTNVEFAVLQTWAYSTSRREDQSVMYEGVVDAGKQSMKDADIGVLIPCGSAIQSARTNSELMSKDDELTEDGSHLSELGDYITGLTIFQTLLSGRYKKDIDSDVAFKPSSVTNYQMYLSKLVAKNATIKPFDISNI